MKEWNETSAEYPRDATTHELFQASCDRKPDVVAASCGDERLTYRELEARANQIAHHLRGLGVGPGVLIGLLIDRSIAMVAAMLGVHLAGGAYVPLDPAYPRNRIAYMLKDCGAPLLLAESSLLDRAAGYSCSLVLRAAAARPRP